MRSDRTIRICVPVCEKDLNALENACARAIEWADVIELRLDCLDGAPEGVSRIVSSLPGPVILTFRPSEQGGYRKLTREAREAFWRNQATRREAVWWDLEAEVAQDVSPDWSRTIVSHHDFSGLPGDLDRIYEGLAQTPAHIIKIAVQANDILDCIPIFRLLDRARHENREIIAIAMGNAGVATRILGPSRGAFLTYGSLGDDRATAPGQVNAPRLRSAFAELRLGKPSLNSARNSSAKLHRQAKSVPP